MYVAVVQYGRQALEIVLKSILGSGPAMVKSEEYTSDFFNGEHPCSHCHFTSPMRGQDDSTHRVSVTTI